MRSRVTFLHPIKSRAAGARRAAFFALVALFSACTAEVETGSSEDELLGIEHNPIEISDNYETKSAKAKLDELEERIHKSEYEKAPRIREDLLFNINGGLNSLRVFVQKSFFNTTIERTADVMPEWREKVIHRYGVTAKVAFEPEPGAQATGMFAKRQEALARFSIVLPPNKQVDFGFAPAMALKFPVDGRPSVNLLLGADTFNGSISSKNFFDVEHSSILPLPKVLIGKVLFQALEAFAGKGNANRLRLDPVFTQSDDGEVDEKAEVPNEIRFVPTKEAHAALGEGSADFRVDLQRLEVGTTLYEISIRKAEGGALTKLGSLRLLEKPVASYYGDRLFFKHEIFPKK